MAILFSHDLVKRLGQHARACLACCPIFAIAEKHFKSNSTDILLVWMQVLRNSYCIVSAPGNVTVSGSHKDMLNMHTSTRLANQGGGTVSRACPEASCSQLEAQKNLATLVLVILSRFRDDHKQMKHINKIVNDVLKRKTQNGPLF